MHQLVPLRTAVWARYIPCSMAVWGEEQNPCFTHISLKNKINGFWVSWHQAFEPKLSFFLCEESSAPQGWSQNYRDLHQVKLRGESLMENCYGQDGEGLTWDSQRITLLYLLHNVKSGS